MLTLLTDRLTRAYNQDVRLQRTVFKHLVRMLKAFNPLDVMERGYSIVYHEWRLSPILITSMEIG